MDDRQGFYMIAKHNGPCRGCDEPIRPGDSMYHERERRNWHSECWDKTNGKRPHPGIGRVNR